MSSGFLISALAFISVLTSLTVEAIKKILNEKEVKYSSNILAAIVAVILTVAVSVGYIIYVDIIVSPKVIITIIALTFLSFLASMLSFDKVKQLLIQIK